MRTELTAERLRELLHYDPKTGVFTRLKEVRCGPRLTRVKCEVGSIAGTIEKHHRYVQIGISGVSHKAHRLAWLYVHGEWPKGHIDHINCVRHDNRLVNLRDVPQAVNNQNLRSARAGSKSGLMGVEPNGSGWIARIAVNKRRRCLGTYPTKEEAYAVYLEAKRRLHEGCTI